MKRINSRNLKKKNFFIIWLKLFVITGSNYWCLHNHTRFSDLAESLSTHNQETEESRMWKRHFFQKHICRNRKYQFRCFLFLFHKRNLFALKRGILKTNSPPWHDFYHSKSNLFLMIITCNNNYPVIFAIILLCFSDIVLPRQVVFPYPTELSKYKIRFSKYSSEDISLTIYMFVFVSCKISSRHRIELNAECPKG